MGSGSKEIKTARPKLRLTEQADVPQGDSGDGMALKSLNSYVNTMLHFKEATTCTFFIADFCNPENVARGILCVFVGAFFFTQKCIKFIF